MNKDRLIKMALASGIALNRLTDGSYTLFSANIKFADMIESAISHKYETERKKDQDDLAALRLKVTAQAGEILRLRTNASNVVNCLDEGVSNG